MDLTDIRRTVEREIADIAQRELIDLIRRLQVEPRQELREWDYAKEPTSYPCWIVLDDPASNTCVAYCEQGFGPSNPWGLLFMTGPHLSIGMDCGWFSRLEDAVRESKAWDGPNPDGHEVR